MARNGKLKRDDALVLALARGLTVRQAAGVGGRLPVVENRWSGRPIFTALRRPVVQLAELSKSLPCLASLTLSADEECEQVAGD